MRFDDIPTLDYWKVQSTESAKGTMTLAAKFEPPTSNVPLVLPAGPRPANMLEIDKLLDLYARAFNPMSKRNVLFDLKSELEARFPTGSRPGDAVVALKDVVARKLGVMPGAWQYTDVICIGWKVGCNYDVRTGKIGPGRLDNPDYFRHSSNDLVDLTAKCEDMFKAITAASGALSIATIPTVRAGATSPKTLKIFMAPEFYFRGANGAYSPELVSKIIPNLRSLGTASPLYNDWLFVFGTAVAAIEVKKTYCKTCFSFGSILFEKDPSNPGKTIAVCKKDKAHPVDTWTFGAEIQNVALVQKGNETAVVAKEYISDIDFLGPDQGKVTIHPGAPNEKEVVTIIPSGSRPHYTSTDGTNPDPFVTQNDERLGGCRLTISGIRITLEVCLDHHPDPRYQRGKALEGSTQILLIPSYGMSIGSGLYCVSGGVAFNVDGRGFGSSEVVVKDRVPRVARALTAPVPGGRGALDVWGPYLIPA